MVTETDGITARWRRVSIRLSVLFPQPDGPESTMINPCSTMSS